VLLGLAMGALLASPSACLAAAGEPVPQDRDCMRFVHGIDLQSATIPRLQAAMNAGRLTSVDLVKAYLARIHAYDHYNAIRALDAHAVEVAAGRDAERRAGQSRGPLQGIPVLLKDNVGTDDLPTTAGSIAMEGAVPRRDATRRSPLACAAPEP